jgi:membrane-bound serine protease (ClpP class)
MLIGMVGEVARDLAPEGKVFVSGELWNAVAEETIAAGEKVEILAVDSLKLKVKKIDGR